MSLSFPNASEIRYELYLSLIPTIIKEESFDLTKIDHVIFDRFNNLHHIFSKLILETKFIVSETITFQDMYHTQITILWSFPQKELLDDKVFEGFSKDLAEARDMAFNSIEETMRFFKIK